MKTKISEVKDGKDKQETYISEINRYKKAIRNEFYFEATIIVYALLEDRINAFLYYLKIANRKSDGYLMWNNKSKKVIQGIYVKLNGEDTKQIRLNKISTKINIIQSIINWNLYMSKDNIGEIEKELIKLCTKLDLKKISQSLNELLDWCDYRNQIVHNLMNKYTKEINDNIWYKTEEAFELVRYIDSQIKKIKKYKEL